MRKDSMKARNCLNGNLGLVGRAKGSWKASFPQRVRTVSAVAKRQLLIKCLLFLFSFWKVSPIFAFVHFLDIFFFFNFYLFIYLFLAVWVFVSVRGLSLVAASGGHSSSRYAGLSLSRSLLLRSTGSRCAGSVVVAHGPSRPAACGIFPDQGSNPCPLHWQADSQPLCHQGSPIF